MPALLLLLDGWEQFLAAAERQDAHEPVETLLALLRAGPSTGLTVVLAGDRGTFAPRLAAAVRTKLVLPLTDPADYALAGIAPRAVPGDPAAGRAIRAADGALVQLAHLGAAPTADERRREIESIARRRPRRPDHPGPIRVRALPAAVALDSLPPVPGPDRSRSGAIVILGVGGDDAAPLVVDLCAGRARLLVAGPPGSGRSTLLLGLLGQLVRQGRRVTVGAAEHAPLAAAARAAGIPLLTPDDEPPGAARPAAEPSTDPPEVLLIDDCEQFRDRPVEQLFTGWAGAPHRPVVVAAGSSDELAVAFRGIAVQVRRARCGVLLRPGPGDGDLLGLPRLGRRAGGPAGRGVLLGDPAWGPQFARGPVPIQVALP
jgi:S-DNA-T family DNA segregation ATPase FtsK/SpoIIIE